MYTYISGLKKSQNLSLGQVQSNFDLSCCQINCLKYKEK